MGIGQSVVTSPRKARARAAAVEPWVVNMGKADRRMSKWVHLHPVQPPCDPGGDRLLTGRRAEAGDLAARERLQGCGELEDCCRIVGQEGFGVAGLLGRGAADLVRPEDGATRLAGREVLGGLFDHEVAGSLGQEGFGNRWSMSLCSNTGLYSPSSTSFSRTPVTTAQRATSPPAG